ncbi:hypothetical protein GCM10010336_50270 [Streptomyces goshikiensis]|nr:hypothetical protein GCM10010336_50270 [Streptomyces goshikiensis]
MRPGSAGGLGLLTAALQEQLGRAGPASDQRVCQGRPVVYVSAVGALKAAAGAGRKVVVSVVTAAAWARRVRSMVVVLF